MFLMHVKDDQAWSQQLVEFDADEMSRLFRDFLVQWAETADRLVEDSGVRGAAVTAFDETEQDLGFISVEWLGQMLLVLVQHWFSGDELWESLSGWERRMVEQSAALKIVELQDLAASSNPEVDTTSDTP